MKVVVLMVIKFFFISALFVISNGNLYLNDANDREVFTDIYSGWLKNVVTQSIEVAGYVIGSEWLPDNNFDNNS